MQPVSMEQIGKHIPTLTNTHALRLKLGGGQAYDRSND
jgi:hypothetical protein